MYYEVTIAQSGSWEKPSLTYSSKASYKPATVVVVPFGNKKLLGLIKGKAAPPDFVAKEIIGRVSMRTLPKAVIELINWLPSYYAASPGAALQQFLPSYLLRPQKTALKKSGDQEPDISHLPKMTKEQSEVIKKIESTKAKTFMLHGETASGKTRIYLELAIRAVQAGRSVIILTPEISLTTQLLERSRAIFGDQTMVVHSGLGDSARRQQWHQILQSEAPLIIIGPRSALFSPLKNIGLIVVDEAHEATYKQEEMPHYNALRVASKLASLHKAQLIYGTATPLVSEYYFAEQKKIPILRMTTNANQIDTSPFQPIIVDLKDKEQFSRHPQLSNILLEKAEQTLQKGEQVMLFLNRRGTARVTLCQNCAWQSMCPRCDLPLTYHHDNFELICHVCGHTSRPPLSCPVCGSVDIQLRTPGTKNLVEQIQKLFHGRTIERFDTDNKTAERIENRYPAIHKGEVDILIGTQLMAKGLDLPKLGMVGVIAADSGLMIPDFSASERTFQLLYQVLGRVDRGYRPTTAVVQTYNPDSMVVQTAVNRRWYDFYQAELKERQQFGFPPFVFLLQLVCSRRTSEGAKKASQKLRDLVQELGLKVEIDGPAPAFYEKQRDNYRWQLIIKSKQRSVLLQIIAILPSGWTYDIDPTDLL